MVAADDWTGRRVGDVLWPGLGTLPLSSPLSAADGLVRPAEGLRMRLGRRRADARPRRDGRPAEPAAPSAGVAGLVPGAGLGEWAPAAPPPPGPGLLRALRPRSMRLLPDPEVALDVALAGVLVEDDDGSSDDSLTVRRLHPAGIWVPPSSSSVPLPLAFPLAPPPASSEPSSTDVSLFHLRDSLALDCLRDSRRAPVGVAPAPSPRLPPPSLSSSTPARAVSRPRRAPLPPGNRPLNSLLPNVAASSSDSLALPPGGAA